MLRLSSIVLNCLISCVFLLGMTASAQSHDASSMQLIVDHAIGATLNHSVAVPDLDMTPIGMYRSAQPVVKGIIIVLLLCSVLTWTVCIVKVLQLYQAMRSVRREQTRLSPIHTIADCRQTISAWNKSSAASRLFHEIDDEIARSQFFIDADLADRVAYRLERKAHEQVQRLRYGIGSLATIGAVAPFVGLFGTVWGIMNSFIGIAGAKNISLAVVAPGIAEALFATAIGLVAAIPAVVLYNLFLRRLNAYQLLTGNLVSILYLVFRRDVSLNRSLRDQAPDAQAMPCTGK